MTLEHSHGMEFSVLTRTKLVFIPSWDLSLKLGPYQNKSDIELSLQSVGEGIKMLREVGML